MFFCKSTAPIAKLEASDSTINCLFRLEKLSIGVAAKASLTSLNSFFSTGNYLKEILVEVNLDNGARIDEISLIKHLKN